MSYDMQDILFVVNKFKIAMLVIVTGRTILKVRHSPSKENVFS